MKYQKQSNLFGLIYQNLIPILKLQLDMPKIPNIDKLLVNPSSLSLDDFDELRGLIIDSFSHNQTLANEFLALIDSLTLLRILNNSENSIQEIEKSYEIVCILKHRFDFEITYTVSSIESAAIAAMRFKTDFNLLKSWINAINKVSTVFGFTNSILKNWFESNLIGYLLRELSRSNEKNICEILEIIQEMQRQDFDLKYIRFFAIDSALFIISDLESQKEFSQISKILSAVYECGIVPSIELKFQKFAIKYPLSIISKAQGGDKLNYVSKSEIVFEKANIYFREAYIYQIYVQKGLISKTNQAVGVKTYLFLETSLIEKIQKEVEILEILSKMKGPFIKFYGSYLENSYSPAHKAKAFELGIVMEFCPKTLISKIIRKQQTKKYFSEAKLLSIISTLLEGFTLMTTTNPKIYHQDIKPHNIFFTQSKRVVIGDFNVSKLTEISNATEVVDVQGTNMYKAPEVQLAFSGKGKYRRGKADVFSFGITMLQMYTCKMQTFNDLENRHLLMEEVAKVKIEWLRNVIEMSLIENFQERPSFKDLIQFLPAQTEIN